MSSPTLYLRDICAKVPRGWVQADAWVMQYKPIGQVQATAIDDFSAFCDLEPQCGVLVLQTPDCGTWHAQAEGAMHDIGDAHRHRLTIRNDQ